MLVKVIFLTLLSLTISACTYGIIYTNTVEPYCKNMLNTSLPELAHSTPLKQISIPQVPGARVRWHTNTINDIAKQAGIKKVAFCDRKRFRILGGIWEEDAIIVYGE